MAEEQEATTAERSTEPKRISISLTGRAAKTVRRMGVELDLNDGEVVRRAIGMLQTITEEQARGCDLLLHEPDGKTVSLRFIPAL